MPDDGHGYLMCTDNMPSGSAMQLGDVLQMRNGKTVEVLSIGRVGVGWSWPMPWRCRSRTAPTRSSASRRSPGRASAPSGPEVAGVMGNDDELIEQVRRAGSAVDEPVWQLPLIRRYRSQLDSEVADITNMGGPERWIDQRGAVSRGVRRRHPLAHIDIAGTAQAEATRRWISKGPTGFGSRLLAGLASGFTPVSSSGAPRAR